MRLTLPLALLLAACPTPGDTEFEDTGGPGEPVQVDHWCEAVRGGPTSSEPFAVGLSEAHAGVRFFGPDGDWHAADATLVAALDGGEPFAPASLEVYAEAQDGVCVVQPDDAVLGPASVRLEGELAVVAPGAGTLELPEGARGVVVDLRDLPARPEADEALRAALSLALAEEVDLGRERYRIFHGHPDQTFSEHNVYTSEAADRTVGLDGSGTADLPLFLVTGQRTSCHAAALAAGLRMGQRAWLVGWDLFGAQAECEWTGVGEAGLAWRARYWQRAGEGAVQFLPERVPADLPTTRPEAVFGDLLDLGEPPELEGDAERSPVGEWTAWGDDHPEGSGRAERRAALVVLHGTLDRFYPYFPLVGDHIDQALLDGLAEVETHDLDDRVAMVHALGRFLHVIEDGHAFFGDLYPQGPGASLLALQLEHVPAQEAGVDVFGEVLVKSSLHEDIHPGDSLVAVDGVPARDWYEEVMGRRSAASLGYLVDLASRELKVYYGDRPLALRDASGQERTVTPTSVTVDEFYAIPWGGSWRESGWLDDLGAPELYLLNLNGSVTTTDIQWQDAIDEAREGGAAGLIVDNRDYPSIDHYSLATWLRTEDFTSPWFVCPTWDGPLSLTEESESFEFSPSSSAWEGPTVLVVGHKTVSAAENFSLMVEQAPPVTVVGQQSASTNGNITGALLPGGFWASFTGMELLRPDGSDFHGIGIVPDVKVVPTQEDYRDGVDPELAAAIEVLQGR